MKLYKACGMPYCAAITKGLCCGDASIATTALFLRVRRLREEGRPDDEVDAAMEEAEDARLHLNELFGEPIEDPAEDPG